MRPAMILDRHRTGVHIIWTFVSHIGLCEHFQWMQKFVKPLHIIWTPVAQTIYGIITPPLPPLPPLSRATVPPLSRAAVPHQVHQHRAAPGTTLGEPFLRCRRRESAQNSPHAWIVAQLVSNIANTVTVAMRAPSSTRSANMMATATSAFLMRA